MNDIPDADPTSSKKYDDLREDLIRLSRLASGLVEGELESRKIDYIQVKSRVKTLESFLSKADRKPYTNPISETTDLVGIRIITYLESEIESIAATISDIFSVDAKNSIDRLSSKDASTIGYRSLHLVCTLGDARKDLHESRNITSIPFEIQVRTALQDTWAEIEHRHNYKGKASLPINLERKLFLLSATLEQVDNSLSEIVQQSTIYSSELKERGSKGDSEPLTMIGALALIERYAEIFEISSQVDFARQDQSSRMIIDELINFGTRTTREFESLLKETNLALLKSILSVRGKVMPIRISRTAMISADITRYFETVSDVTLRRISEASLKILEEYFPEKNVRDTVIKRGFIIT